MIKLKQSVLNRVKRNLAITGPITANALHAHMAIQRHTLTHSLHYFAQLGLIESKSLKGYTAKPRYKLINQ